MPAALCLKSGNAAILRGGSDSHHSSRAIQVCLARGLARGGIARSAVQLVPTTDREAVGLMLKGLDGAIDVIVPRGGKSLVARVQEEARVPVFAHLEGLCHTYVHRSAELDMAKAIVLNAKLRRTGVCGATETLLVDKAAPAGHLAALVGALADAGCEVRGDAAAQAADNRVLAASEQDWSTEYLDAIIAVRVSTASREPLPTSAAMAHSTPIASSPTTAPPPSAFSPASTALLCCTTPPRNSPTAANSAWARKSASPPGACMPAARSASSS